MSAAVLADCAVGSRFIAVPYRARRLPALPPHALRRSCVPAGLAIAVGSLTVPSGTDKTKGGKRRFLPGRSAGVFAPRLR
jgi:hypothetical protein